MRPHCGKSLKTLGLAFRRRMDVESGDTAGLSSSAKSTVGQANRGTRQLGCAGLFIAVTLLHTLLSANAADMSGRVPWATGRQLTQTLAQPLDVFWSNNPLRDAMTSLSRAQRVAILIDRRVDPGQRLSLSLQNVPLESVLQTVAARCGLGLGRLGPIVYLAPPAAATRLRPLAMALDRAVRQLPAAAQRKFFRSQPLAWEDLTTPRDLLAQLGQQNGIELAGLERVPHDLWAAAELPPLSLVERLTLIAAQFDLSFKIAGGGARLELAPMPENLRGLPADRPTISATQAATKSPLTEAATNIERVRIERLSVRAKPLGPVLRQLAQRLGLELKLDEQAIGRAGISLEQRVSVLVENASVDQLLRELLKSTGLTFHRRQNVVEILPAD